MTGPDDAAELAAIEDAMNLRLGYIEVTGVDSDGQTHYRLTDIGRKRVESMVTTPRLVEDWRTVTLPDGRVVEYVDATRAASRDEDPLGSMRVTVTVRVDGSVGSVDVLLTAEQIAAAGGAS